jgi:hypothetical protein
MHHQFSTELKIIKIQQKVQSSSWFGKPDPAFAFGPSNDLIDPLLLETVEFEARTTSSGPPPW